MWKEGRTVLEQVLPLRLPDSLPRSGAELSIWVWLLHIHDETVVAIAGPFFHRAAGCLHRYGILGTS